MAQPLLGLYQTLSGRAIWCLEDIYQHDAYNSLSIEGYRVTPEIIERVRAGDWGPAREQDREHVATMAAKGYCDAFRLVKKAVGDVLQGANPATAAQTGLQDWYRALLPLSPPGLYRSARFS